MVFSVSRGFVDRRPGHDNNTIHEMTLNITNATDPVATPGPDLFTMISWRAHKDILAHPP